MKALEFCVTFFNTLPGLSKVGGYFEKVGGERKEAEKFMPGGGLWATKAPRSCRVNGAKSCILGVS